MTLENDFHPLDQESAEIHSPTNISSFLSSGRFPSCRAHMPLDEAHTAKEES